MSREESPDSTEHCTSERGDVREGIVTEKRTTAPVCRRRLAFVRPALWQAGLHRAMVRRRGKSPPGHVVTHAAVCLAG